jgi:hypothetical protein
LESLETESRLWRERNPYRITHEPDPQTNKKLIRVKVLEQPPAAIRLIIGDCVHNLRSALDNLAYALAEDYRDYISKSRVDTTLTNDLGHEEARKHDHAFFEQHRPTP